MTAQYVPQFNVNPMIDGNGVQDGFTYPVVSNAQALVDYLNGINPAWGVKLITGPAGGINPFSNQPNLSPNGEFHPQTAQVPYLMYAGGGSEDAYNVANIFRHGFYGYFLMFALNNEITGTQQLWQLYQSNQ